jgi:hypothetical protein
MNSFRKVSVKVMPVNNDGNEQNDIVSPYSFISLFRPGVLFIFADHHYFHSFNDNIECLLMVRVKRHFILTYHQQISHLIIKVMFKIQKRCKTCQGPLFYCRFNIFSNASCILNLISTIFYG